MKQGYEALTEKEKQTLRLLLVGHDAKSMARQLDLSVHTVNERLRHARRKLSAASSKEAARLLRESEGDHPQRLGDEALGDALAVAAGPPHRHPDAASLVARPLLWAIGGLAMIAFVVALLTLSGPTEPAPAPAPTHSPAAETAATRAARDWLALVDGSKWAESWAGTSLSFRSLNTVQAWQSASEQARVPLGPVLSRTLLSEQDMPAPPKGLKVVRFSTDFANKSGATETVSLDREGDAWKVVGIYID